jgi:hypothetical protein
MTTNTALVTDILAARWPGGDGDGFPSRRVAEMLAEHLTAAGWVHKAPAIKPPAPRIPTPEDFLVEWDEDHVFNFFEDDSATALWAHVSLSDEEFVRQANEYDKLCDPNWDERAAYEVGAGVPQVWAVVEGSGLNERLRVVPEGTVASLVKRIDR